MPKKLALVIGGGAPNATLMAGSLVAFIERNVQFDVVSTSGAGALVGLLYKAPKNGDPVASLKSLVGMGVDDLIYDAFPVNYKVFNKPGAFADLWRQMQAANPILQQIDALGAAGGPQRLFADSIKLMLATLCPTDLNAESTGLCAHVPFIETIVDFGKLKSLDTAFYLNAYNLTRHVMESWHADTINKDHFLAALSFPFIYPPYRIGDDYYIEGAAIDTLNFKGLFQQHRQLDTVVVFDVLGCEQLLRPPRNLYDAWVLSIITPLVEIARDDLKLFEALHNTDPETGKPRCALLKVDYQQYLTPEDTREELDWSASNLQRMYDVGYEAGHAFCDRHAAALNLKP